MRLMETGWIIAVLCLVAAAEAGEITGTTESIHPMSTVKLTRSHIAAINRQRRVILDYDNGAVFWGNQSVENPPGEADIGNHVARCFSVIDDPDSQVDSVWWDWSNGNIVAYPSKVLPTYEFFPLWKEWFKSGVDPVRVFLEETRKRKLEVFYSYRINAPDAAELPYSPFKDGHPLKKAHPEWLLWAQGDAATRMVTHSQWNFAEPGVRDLKVRILEELARNYEYDGIHLNFARNPPLVPPDSAWENRNAVTQFMRALRTRLLEVETQTDRPILLSAQVGPSLSESHMDGLDPETWAREQLVDLLVLGARSSDVDLEDYRRITADTHIKLYPSWDDYHSSDGYRHQPPEHLRGVFANWWGQGADGMHCFNFDNQITPDPSPDHPLAWRKNRQLYREIGSPETLKCKDKFFVVQRRGWDSANYRTAREAFITGNILAQLPAEISNDAGVDTILSVRIGDDVNLMADRVDQISIHLLLSGPDAKDLPEDQRIPRGLIRKTLPWGTFEGMDGRLYTTAPAKGIDKRIQLRLNNVMLDKPVIEDGWLVFHNVPPKLCAAGENLVGAGLRPDSGQRLVIEKLEVHVKYR